MEKRGEGQLRLSLTLPLAGSSGEEDPLKNTLKFILTLEDVNELVPTIFDSLEIKEDKVDFLGMI